MYANGSDLYWVKADGSECPQIGDRGRYPFLVAVGAGWSRAALLDK